MGEPYTWKPEDPEIVRKREETEATTILQAQVRKDVALVKVYSEMVNQMAEVLKGSYSLATVEGQKQIYAHAPAEFTEAAHELRAAVERLMQRVGIYR